jgi:hypothetical protein
MPALATNKHQPPICVRCKPRYFVASVAFVALVAYRFVLLIELVYRQDIGYLAGANARVGVGYLHCLFRIFTRPVRAADRARGW